MIEINSELVGNISMNNSGSAYFKATDQPKDIYIHKTNTKQALHLDQVKVKIIKGKGRAIEGIVVEVLERFKTKFVGTLQVSEKFAFFVPDSLKMVVDVFIPLKKINGATHGQKVVVEITDWKENKKTPNGKVVKVLGTAGDNDTEIHSIMEEYGLAYEFNEDVIAEAEAISKIITPEEIAKRRDFRNVLTICIDPLGSRDKDDSISIVELGDGITEIGVHIADVTHYVKEDTELDREAYIRGNSVYLVDRVVPMFPEILSGDICSLHPHIDKLTLSAVFKINDNGEVISEWFGRTIINIDNDFTYEKAQSIIEGDIDESLDDSAIRGIIKLDEIAKQMRAKRLIDSDSLVINKVEPYFVLDENKVPIDIKLKVQKDANRLIEEFMLLANKRVCEYITKNNNVSIHRIHPKPDTDKLNELKVFAESVGYSINTADDKLINGELNRLLNETKGTNYENIFASLVPRCMSKAQYDVVNLGHFGLGFEYYTHFTSCIRRYSDIIAHRLLIQTLGNYGYTII